jgi:hypothetical protein
MRLEGPMEWRRAVRREKLLAKLRDSMRAFMAELQLLIDESPKPTIH